MRSHALQLGSLSQIKEPIKDGNEAILQQALQDFPIDNIGDIHSAIAVLLNKSPDLRVAAIVHRDEDALRYLRAEMRKQVANDVHTCILGGTENFEPFPSAVYAKVPSKKKDRKTPEDTPPESTDLHSADSHLHQKIKPGRQKMTLEAILASSNPEDYVIRQVMPIIISAVKRRYPKLNLSIRQEMVGNILLNLIEKKTIPHALNHPNKNEAIGIILGTIEHMAIYEYSNHSKRLKIELPTDPEIIGRRRNKVVDEDDDISTEEIKAERLAIVKRLVAKIENDNHPDRNALVVLKWMLDKIAKGEINESDDSKETAIDTQTDAANDEINESDDGKETAVDIQTDAANDEINESDDGKETAVDIQTDAANDATSGAPNKAPRKKGKVGIATLISQETGMSFHAAQSVYHRLKKEIPRQLALIRLEDQRKEHDHIRAVHAKYKAA